MRLIYSISVLLLLLGLRAGAQPYYGFQIIGLHTLYVSVGFEQKPTLGFGYCIRDNTRSIAYADWSAEIRFPADEMWRFNNYTIIAGAHMPFVARTWFMAAGAHLRLRRQTLPEGTLTTLGLAASLLPSVYYNSSLGDQPSGTLAVRGTFMPVLAAHYKGSGAEGLKSGWNGWPGAYQLEVGGHADLHLERTLSASLNGAWVKQWQQETVLPALPYSSRPITGDLILGSTYWLKRL